MTNEARTPTNSQTGQAELAGSGPGDCGAAACACAKDAGHAHRRQDDVWLLTLRPLQSIYESSSSPRCWGCRK